VVIDGHANKPSRPKRWQPSRLTHVLMVRGLTLAMAGFAQQFEPAQQFGRLPNNSR
jgi:hypothetical protein